MSGAPARISPDRLASMMLEAADLHRLHGERVRQIVENWNPRAMGSMHRQSIYLRPGAVKTAWHNAERHFAHDERTVHQQIVWMSLGVHEMRAPQLRSCYRHCVTIIDTINVCRPTVRA